MASIEKDKIFEALEEKTSCPINTNYLICPISQQIIRYPVKASDKRTYDRASLRNHIVTLVNERKPIISPLTRENLQPFNPKPSDWIDRYMMTDYDFKAIIDNARKIEQAAQNAAEYSYTDSSSDDEKSTPLGYFYEDPEELVNTKPLSSPTNSDIEEEPSEELVSPVPIPSEPERQPLHYGRNRFFTKDCVICTTALSGTVSLTAAVIGSVCAAQRLMPVPIKVSCATCGVLSGTVICSMCTPLLTAGIVYYTLSKGADFEAQYRQNQIDNAPPPPALDMVEDHLPENRDNAQSELIVPENANAMVVSETEPEETIDDNNPNAALISPQANPSEEEFRLRRYFGC